MDLKGKIAVVTGAGSGLGAAIAAALVREGSLVYGMSRTEKNLLQLRDQLGKQFIPAAVDITERNTVSGWFSGTFSHEHSPDILINNAGTGEFARLDEIAPEKWYAMINTNLNGLYHVTSRTIPWMRAKKQSSHILTIGSILGSSTRSEGAAYSATKFGVRGFSESLFKELRGDNIKVSLINPGSIETDFFKSSGIEKHSNMLQPEDLAEAVIFVLKTPDNMLINDMTIRPLDPRPK